MSKLFSSVVGLFLLVIAANILGEECYLIRKQAFNGENSYEVISREQNEALKSQARKESFQSSKALKLAQKEWNQDETNPGSFPRSAAKTPKIQVLKRYRDMAEANDAIAKYTERESKRPAKDAAKMKRRYTRTSNSKRGGSRGRSKQTLDTKRYNAAVQKNQERENYLQSANTIYIKHLKQCVTEFDEMMLKKKQAYEEKYGTK